MCTIFICINNLPFSPISEKICKVIPTVENAHVALEVSSGILGSVINITCDEDYVMDSAMSYAIKHCNVDGTWHGDEVICYCKFFTSSDFLYLLIH